MLTTDPNQIPANPVYTITVNSNGAAALDGEEVTKPGLDPNEARVAALAEVRIKAAFHGRPVRVLAKEADGATWPLIVAVDGTVTTLSHPHPTPPPAQPPTPAQPPPAAPTPQPAGEWAAPLPPQYASAWIAVTTHARAGRFVDAIITADQLENALAGTLGPLAPATINVMTARAWLTLRQTKSGDWAETTDLLVQTAQRRREAKAPEDDTEHTIRNAHAAWIRLIREDPEYARELAEPVLLLLGDRQEHARRAQAVIQLLEQGARAS
ncbi:hypothetical protein ACIQU6_39985 [Streptomyces sp. NPDC090442]|uniref:hypothetical protein n=1 Tax=Streptomyces sp. NPDC090442 TaxID=3365962 RepID=UPI0037FDEB92